MDLTFAVSIFNMQVETTSTPCRALSKGAQLTHLPLQCLLAQQAARNRAVFLIQCIVTRGELVNHEPTLPPSVAILKWIVAL